MRLKVLLVALAFLPALGACTMVRPGGEPGLRPPERATPTPPPEERPRPRDRPTPPAPVPDPLPREVKALWVVRTTLSHPDSIRRMVERAARAGFNTLLVQVRGRGDAYYRSRWEPGPGWYWSREGLSIPWIWSFGRPMAGAWGSTSG